jgi:hypothetical protein
MAKKPGKLNPFQKRGADNPGKEDTPPKAVKGAKPKKGKGVK